MSLKHAWLILQMVPLVLSAPTSTDKVPALPRLSPTASRDVIGANLWNWKTSVTSPCEEDIKPRPLQRHLSGSGGTTAAMSLEHAWLILQIPGYLSWKDLGYMSEVHSSSRCAVNVWGAVSKDGTGPLVRLSRSFTVRGLLRNPRQPSASVCSGQVI
ncbi:hypothetical protein MRX96_044540 [Rhipicephalus microplus]